MKLLALLKTKDGKTLIENFISLSSLQMVTMLLPLITLPYILRVLGYEKFGIIALAASLIAYFQSVVDYSFKVTAVRDIAIHRNNPHQINIIYSRVMTVKIIFLTFAFALIGIIVYLYPPFFEEKQLFLYTALSLIGFSLFPEWFFQGMEQMKYITLINVTIRVLFTISIFIFVKEESDYILYPLLTSVGVFISGIVGQVFLYKKFNIKFIVLTIKQIKETISKNFPIFVNQFMPNLYNNTTSFLLGVLISTEMLGIYTAIIRIIDICIVLLSIVSRVFFPLINRAKDTFLIYKNLMFTLVVIGLTILFLSHQLIFWYLGLNNPIALPILVITGLSILGFVAYDIYGLNYFIVHRQDKLVMKNTIFCSIVGLIVATPLITLYGAIGAALTLFIGRFLMGGTLMYKYVRYKNV